MFIFGQHTLYQIYMFRILLIVFFLRGITCDAQLSGQFLYLDQRPLVSVNGKNLVSAWAGGLNSPILNEIDLNGDGVKDLFTFDRVGERISTFINDAIPGLVSYHFDASYIKDFPVMSKWVRAVDFDCDGDLDLFTYENKAIAVYRNDYSVGTGLVFTLVTSHLTAWFGTFYKDVSGSDLNVPAFMDIDNDGDIDVLIFANSNNTLEYYRNYYSDSSATSSCNGFNLFYQPYCWGDFQLDGLANFADLNVTCRGNLINDDAILEKSTNRHAGSILLGFDQGCDGDYDLLNGDVLGTNLLFLENGGTSALAHITAQDTFFPSNSNSVNLANLPSPAYLDVNNDGNKDLIVTPAANAGEDFFNVLYYENLTNNCTNQFSYVSNRMLVEDMIDVGTSSNSAFVDIDKDGLLDMIVGNEQYYNSNPSLSVSRLSYFRNTGSLIQPSFSLVTDDWLGLSSLLQSGLFPAFGDIDADGDLDLLLGNSTGDLIYYQNTAAIGSPSIFTFVQAPYQGIVGGNNSVPQLIDVDRDGKIDLLLGNRNGKIKYYRNTSSVSVAPIFTLITSTFGNVNVTKVGAGAGLSVPLLYDVNGVYELLVGSESGYIYQYGNIDGNLSGTFLLIDTNFQHIYEPKSVSIARGDIDGDGKFDLLTGNRSGGLRLYTQSVFTSLNSYNKQLDEIKIFPNPASNSLTIRIMKPNANGTCRYEMNDMLGKIVLQNSFIGDEVEINVSSLLKGVYTVKMNINDEIFVKKIVKE